MSRLGAAMPSMLVLLALAAIVAAGGWLGLPHARATDELSGRWVMAQLSTTVATVPVVGDVYASSRLVTLLNLKHEGARLHGKGMICAMDIDTGSSLVTTTLPQAFLRSLPRPFVDATLRRDGGGSLLLEQRRTTLVVGARLDDPEHDPLPRTLDAPGVYDQDGDGHPGVTIEIGGLVPGQIYVAQRSWTELSGRAIGPSGFEGRVDFGNEQVVLDATSHMLEDPPVSRAVPSRSRFRLVRAPRGTRCRDATAMAHEWFE